MKTGFIVICLSVITSSVYARSDFCPEAGLSEKQRKQIKEQKKAGWAEFQAHILETVPASEEQKVVLSQCFENRKKRRNFCPEAELSEEQKAQIRELRQNFRNSVKDKSKDERQAARAELHGHILEVVPTSEEQRVALSECYENRKKRRNFCPEAGLSKEQKAQIREQRRAARKEIQAHILETVPASEEQKVALSECYENRRKHH